MKLKGINYILFYFQSSNCNFEWLSNEVIESYFIFVNCLLLVIFFYFLLSSEDYLIRRFSISFDFSSTRFTFYRESQVSRANIRSYRYHVFFIVFYSFFEFLRLFEKHFYDFCGPWHCCSVPAVSCAGCCRAMGPESVWSVITRKYNNLIPINTGPSPPLHNRVTSSAANSYH